MLLDDLFLVFLSGFGAGFLGGLSPLPQTLPPTFVLPKWGNIRAYKSCVEGSERSIIMIFKNKKKNPKTWPFYVSPPFRSLDFSPLFWRTRSFLETVRFVCTLSFL